MLRTRGRSAIRSGSVASMSARATGYIIRGAESCSSCCPMAEARAARHATSRRRSASPRKPKMVLKVTRFDPAEHLESAEDILHYLEAAMEGNDPKHIASALGDVARSQGMTEIAKKSGLG